MTTENPTPATDEQIEHWREHGSSAFDMADHIQALIARIDADRERIRRLEKVVEAARSVCQAALLGENPDHATLCRAVSALTPPPTVQDARGEGSGT